MLQAFADDASDYIDRQYKSRLYNLNRMIRDDDYTSNSDALSKSGQGWGPKFN